MIRVISYKICPFVQRVTALLEAKNIPYEIEYISLKNKPEWFTAISPNAQVPLIITESGAVLFESDAIIEYLDEIHAPLEPGLSAEQRAVDRAWSYQASKHYMAQCSAMRSADKETFDERSNNLQLAFARAEKQIQAGPFFKGGSFSNVDIAWLPLLHRAAIVEENTGYDYLDGYPRVKAWQLAILGKSFLAKSVSEDFEQLFKGFYLSDETYLGNGLEVAPQGVDRQAMQ